MKKKFTKMLTSSVLVASIVVPSFAPAAFADEATNARDYRNYENVLNTKLGDGNFNLTPSVSESVYGDAELPKAIHLPQLGSEVNTPLVQSVTPALGSTVVRPDQTVEVQLNINSLPYKFVSKFADRFLSGYILDGKSVTPLDRSQIKFDPTTGKVSVQHPVLNRYTTYAVILGFSPDGVNRPFWQDADNSLDVVTAVDPISKTVTTLNHGTVPTSIGGFDVGKFDSKFNIGYAVGDVISVMGNKYLNKSAIIPRKAMGASTIFTTGSSIGEPSNFTADVESPKVRVTDVGKINFTATDDYGLPATNVDITVTSDSTNLTSNPLVMNNGVGVITFTDRKKESANLTITAQDKTNPNLLKKVVVPVQFISGLPDHMTIQADTSLVVGKSGHVTGTVFDKYENTVEDDTVITATPSQGTITPQQNSKDGTFDFTFDAPTKTQTITIGAKAGDTASNSAEIKLKADQPANVKLTTDTKVVKADGTSQAHVSLTVTDQYGNPVIGEPISLQTTGTAAIPDNITTDENGVATFTVADNVGGLNEITASTGNGVKSPVASVITAVPMGANDKVSLTAVKQTDGTVNVSGKVVDANGKPVPYAYVPIEAAGGSLSDNLLAADPSGTFTTILTPASNDTLAKVSVPTASNAPEIGIDPLIYGNQTWTDTGIDVVAGQMIRVVSTGPWTADLFAQLNGYAIKVGADGTFIAGASGRLYLGQNGVIRSGDVDSIIYLSGNAEYPDVLPTVNFVSDVSSLKADGKATATIKGRVMEGLYPVIGAVINLTATQGTIPANATTDTNGDFTVTYTSGTVAGDAYLSAKYSNLQQNITLKLTKPTNLNGMQGVTPPKGTVITGPTGSTPVTNLIDEDMTTSYNVSTPSSTGNIPITLNFLTPQKITGVHVATIKPGGYEYQQVNVYGLKDGMWWHIGLSNILVSGQLPPVVPVGGNVNADAKHGSKVTEWDAISVKLSGGTPWKEWGAPFQIQELTIIQ
jgi:hypothetical protein